MFLNVLGSEKERDQTGILQRKKKKKFLVLNESRVRKDNWCLILKPTAQEIYWGHLSHSPAHAHHQRRKRDEEKEKERETEQKVAGIMYHNGLTTSFHPQMTAFT